MEHHSSYPDLSNLVKKYPKHAGSLFQTYNDILLAQQWRDVEVQDLGDSHSRGYITGRRPIPPDDGEDDLLFVIPCAMSETISMGWLSKIFEVLLTQEIHLAINTEDSSIVYYKLSDGIVKPFV